jgi:ribosomal protein S18 acetylase RimI-like enzyme
MFLETANDNFAAQALYEKAGWAREGRFLKYNAPLGSLRRRGNDSSG